MAGPPKSGKSTLIRSLVKRYTKQTLGEIRGPLTVISGKNRRYTIVESSNDLNHMIDLGKIADLVLLVINAKNGFEMETFEFLNILQTHGFPKVVGIMTNLDTFSDNKALKNKKKTIKKRFWTEVYDGAKIFYMTKFVNNKYFKSEILILTKFMSTVKFRPLIWRNTHSYALIDRVEDLTEPELIKKNEKCDRKVYLYGYNRGTNMRLNSLVHIPGVGDCFIEDIKQLEDPCALIDQSKRTLTDKDRCLYAPYSDVSGIRYDSDAVYVNIPGRFALNKKDSDFNTAAAAQLLSSIKQDKEGLSNKIKDFSLKLFSDSEKLKAIDVSKNQINISNDTNYDGKKLLSDSDSSDDENSISSDRTSSFKSTNFTHVDTHVSDQNSDLKSFKDIKEKSPFNLVNVVNTSTNLRAGDLVKKIYETDITPQSIDNNAEDIFVKKDSNNISVNNIECPKMDYIVTSDSAWESEKELESLRFRFVSSKDEDNESTNDTPDKSIEDKKIALKRRLDLMDIDSNDDSQNVFLAAKEEELKRKQKTLEKFQDEDHNTVVSVLGYTPGKYLRFTLTLPFEFIKYHSPTTPIILGVIGNNEQSTCFLNARLKKHRWYKKILKSNDPLVFSVGWRRFQSLPLYYTDETVRKRYLKYTPEHMYCNASFFGFGVPPNTGFCAFQSVKRDVSNFRICATGVVLDISTSVNIVKKLKLVGTPAKIHKNTAFIKDMFNSQLEVAKFEGSSIRTVSGIRGQIKKSVNKPEGMFRATFEDKILMSDIVFLKAWYPVEPTKFINPVTNTLSDKGIDGWLGMRTASDIRHSLDIKVNSNPDSTYRTVERKKRKFEKLHIPSSLQKKLPYASKPKNISKRRGRGLMKSTAIMVERPERKIRNIVQKVITIAKDKAKKREMKAKEMRKLMEIAKKKAVEKN